ncbi:MAG: glycosyltransferase family 4 protein [Thermodesulfobacteriota bacterium]
MTEIHAAFDRFVAALQRDTLPARPTALLEALDGLMLDPPARAAPRPGRLRVAIVSREYPPDTAFGGMATFARHLARGLADAGHQVTVVTVGGPRFERDPIGIDVVRIAPRLRGARESVEDLMHHGRLPYARTVFCHGAAVLRQIEILERAQGRFDVLDLADHAAEGLVPALVHGGATTLRLYSPSSVLAAMRAGFTAETEDAALTLLEATLLRRCDVITAPSRELAARTRSFFALTRDVALVPNPIDTQLFHPIAAGSRPAAPGRAMHACFVGRLEERKGIRTLLAAIPLVASANPAVRFTIVGPDLLGFGAGHARTLPRDRVLFRSRVPLEELPRVYQSADLAVVPSNYDNSPYTCVEPMACGIPVVGTAVGGIPEYVADGETGCLVPPRDPTALAEAILRLAADSRLRSHMGEAARIRVERLYDHRRVTAEMERLYRAALAADAIEVSGAIDHRWSPRPTLSRSRPELGRLEVVVRAAGSPAPAVERTLTSLRDQGVEATILCEAEDVAHMPRGRLLVMSGSEGSVVRRVLSTVLADAFVVLRAGTTLRPSFADRALCLLAATGRRSVAVDGVAVFLASAALGFALADDWTWEGALQRLASEHRDDTAPPPPLAPWEPRWRADPPPSRLSHAVARVRAALWSSRLRPLRRVLRTTLAVLPHGAALAAQISARRVSDLLPSPDGVPRRPPRLTLVGVTSASARDLARDGDPDAAELWVLGEVLPAPLWPHVLCFLARTRPVGLLRLARNVPLDGLPEDYRAALTSAVVADS